jgi:hypothetical protein
MLAVNPELDFGIKSLTLGSGALKLTHYLKRLSLSQAPLNSFRY